MKSILGSLLSVRLFLLLMPFMVIIFALFAYIHISIQASHLNAITQQNADDLSDVIVRSARYSMLLDRREDVAHIVKTVGDKANVKSIRIYNKKGMIAFATQPGEVGTIVDMKAQACYSCHEHEEPKQSVPLEMRTHTWQEEGTGKVLNVVRPIRNEYECYSAPCHAHSESQPFLGMLEVKTSLQEIEGYISSHRNNMILSAIVQTILIAALSGGFIWLVVHIPVKKLIQGTREISKGNLEYTIDIQSQDEIGTLARSFNDMTRKLAAAYDEIKQASLMLEKRVQEKTEEINRAQGHLFQIERMASIGRLAATVAHELNNPLAGVLNYAKLSAKRLQQQPLSPENTSRIVEELSLIADETMRCGNIVKNLLIFSKQQGGEFTVQSLNAIIKRSLNVIEHHLTIQGIRLENAPCEGDDMLLCNTELLQQAFLALFVNAVEAMPDGGTLSVVSQCVSKSLLEVTITDTGVGISEMDLPHIFEPFFTTKDEDGKGTGLGLSVVYGIMAQHGGTIDVTSRPNQGTRFALYFSRDLQDESA